MPTLTFQTEHDTLTFGRALADIATAGDVITLSGPLGAGKTVLARGFVSQRVGQGIDVASPTFTLVNVYDSVQPPVWHCDFYRLDTPRDVEELGLDDAFSDGITLIEWPECASGYLPDDRLDITLTPKGELRTAEITASTAWTARLETLLAGSVNHDS